MVSRGQKAYREFIKSAFWIELSAARRSLVNGCERCGSGDRLQCHHKFYRSNWYDTQPEDLIVLCRRCHAKVHHKRVVYEWPFMIHRDDPFFSAAIFRCSKLKEKIWKGKELRSRDEAFLRVADQWYPPEPTDRCMEFHVGQVWEAKEKAKRDDSIHSIIQLHGGLVHLERVR